MLPEHMKTVLLACVSLACAAEEARWTTVAATGSPTARHESAMVAIAGKAYLLGGRGIKPVEEFNPATSTHYAQFRRHYRQCLNDLRDLQNDRQAALLPPDDFPNEPTPPPAPSNEPNSAFTSEPCGLKKSDEYRANPPKLAYTSSGTAREPGFPRES